MKRLLLLTLLIAAPAYAQDTKISALPDGSPGQATDAIPIARAGANYRLPFSAFATGFLPLTGGTMTGPLVLPLGDVTNPALQFGSATYGFYLNGTILLYKGPMFDIQNFRFESASFEGKNVNSQDLGLTNVPFRSGFFGTSIVLKNATTGESQTKGMATELLTLSTGAATTDTTANLLPANSIIDAVVVRVTTAITTAANSSVGDPTTAARFSSGVVVALGTIDVGLKHQQGSISTDATGPVQTAAAKVRITCNTTPGAGVVRITVFYRTFTSPSS